MTTKTRSRSSSRPFRKPRRTDGPHYARFASRYCRHTKGVFAGRPLELEAFQSSRWDELLELGADGRRIYSTSVDGRPRKNYKSTELAAGALYLAGPDGEPEADVFLGASARDQAEVVFGQARSMVQSKASDLDRFFDAKQTVIRYPRTSGSIRKVSADGYTAHGLNPHAVVLDELHAFRTEGQLELYRAMTTGQALRRDPLVMTITTAGFDKATLLGELYDAALKLPDAHRYGKHGALFVGRDRDAGLLFSWYGAPEGSDIENRELWLECNPAEHVTLEYLERQWKLAQTGAGGLTVNDFCRLHLNMWTAAKDRWILDEDWKLTRSGIAIPARARIYVGVDASITYDTTAVAWGHRLEDGRVVHRCRVWSTRQDIPHDVFVPGGRIDLELIEDFVAGELATIYAIEALVYDPRFFEDTATRLSKRGVRVAPMQQGSADMYDATQHFYSDVRERRVLTAEDAGGDVLERHVQATAAVKTERGYKLSKLRSSRPIDATVAVVMEHALARGNVGVSAYNDRDLLVIGGDDGFEDIVADMAEDGDYDLEDDRLDE